MFRSTAERYTAEEKMNWSEHIDFLIDVTSKTFAANEIRTENLPIELEIDGLTFRGFHSQLIAPNGDVFGVQEFYARIINGYYFSVNLTYTNLEDKSILHKAWQNSRFFKFPGVSSN